jgi:hypothetical protein
MNPVLGATVFGNCDINDFLTLEKIKGELQGKADVVLRYFNAIIYLAY